MNRWIFVVVRKSSKKMIPEEWELENLNNPSWPKGLKTTLAFKSRRTAMKWVNYWIGGKELYDVVGVELNISPTGKLIV